MKKTILTIIAILSLIIVTAECSGAETIDKNEYEDPRKGND